jgi:hypothetical protein
MKTLPDFTVRIEEATQLCGEWLDPGEYTARYFLDWDGPGNYWLSPKACERRYGAAWDGSAMDLGECRTEQELYAAILEQHTPGVAGPVWTFGAVAKK